MDSCDSKRRFICFPVDYGLISQGFGSVEPQKEKQTLLGERGKITVALRAG
jgi:hypothetical protein